MTKPVRRVVTGHDAQGRAVVVSDGPAPFVHVNALDPDWHSTVLGDRAADAPG
jgi:hypothetical protein